MISTAMPQIYKERDLPDLSEGNSLKDGDPVLLKAIAVGIQKLKVVLLTSCWSAYGDEVMRDLITSINSVRRATFPLMHIR